MTLFDAVILFAAATFAGALNSVAGGGSFISFPALVFTGVAPKIANATNTIALWPGSAASVGAYRRELMHIPGLIPLLIVSLIGGIIGAVVLQNTPESTFSKLVPFLLLIATLLFAFGRNVSAGLRGHVIQANLPPLILHIAVLALQAIVSIYGGFFGAGIGILMLAVLALAGMENIHEMNALKTLLATCINGSAVVVFIAANMVVWPQAVVMIIGAILGGYFGAYFARKLNPVLVRRFVILVGVLLTIYFFVTTDFLV